MMSLPPFNPQLWRALSGSRERRLFITLLLIAVLGWAFLKIASEVMEGDTQIYDARMLLWVREATGGDALALRWLRNAMLDITALGDPAMLVAVTGLSAGFLLVIRHRAAALLLVVVVALGSVTGMTLKALFARNRPDIVTHLVEVQSASFPSGHAMHSAIVYLTLAALIAREVRARGARIYVISAACALTVSIGLSRIYLGVHWPSDVLAGWTIGSAWAFGASLLMARLQRSGAVDQPKGSAPG